MASPFLSLTSLRASPFSGFAVSEFNFVEGFAVLWLRRFWVSRFAVSVPSAFLASLFISFYVSNCLTSLRASLFQWPRRF